MNRIPRADKTEVNRWKLPADRKPCIILSRFVSRRYDFSVLLFSPLWDRCSILDMTWRLAAPYEGSLSVMMCFGTMPCFCYFESSNARVTVAFD
jgi:hypothetical protein